MAFSATQHQADEIDQKSRALLRSIRDGDATSTSLLLELHQRRLIGYFRARRLPEVLLPAAVKHVFQKVLDQTETVPVEHSIRAWLLRLAREELARQASSRSMKSEGAWARLCLELDSVESPDDFVQRIDTRAAELPQMLAALDESQRETLQMVYRDRHDSAAIAVKSKRSERAVVELLAKARATLQQQCSETERPAHDDT